ncbi:MAG: DUF1572 family protein [Phycisphaeraceae bacterium]|nr:DUF1572 family protein [Phycisphaerales bacterium]MCB9844236.1 DUF1572 family protein [Phycisphaeraceae bacterium]
MSRVAIEAFEQTFAGQKSLAERAIAQMSDAQMHASAAPGMNPIAVIMRHMAGNMRSRWTDFLTADGEKPTRDRDSEFADDHLASEALMQRWDDGWCCVFDALSPLTDADLERTITIRGQPHTVARAIARQIDHYGYHTGQIVTFARILAGDQWRHLSVPPGGTDAFNRSMGYIPSV